MLVRRTFNRVMHRPSAEKEWQQPPAMVFPSCPPRRSPPLEVQATSYFAASVRIWSFSSMVTDITSLKSN
jgi:hypothetical protein